MPKLFDDGRIRASLESGDHLTGEEFLANYEQLPEIKRAELLQGEVMIASPAGDAYRGTARATLISTLGYYAVPCPALSVSAHGTVELNQQNIVQPNVTLRLAEDVGGNSFVNERDNLSGPPELIGEVANSHVSYELHRKKDVYLAQGVKEYIVWRVHDRKIDWFFHEEDQYHLIEPEQGILKSRTFPGLWLDPLALTEDRGCSALECLQEGMATAETVAYRESFRKSD